MFCFSFFAWQQSPRVLGTCLTAGCTKNIGSYCRHHSFASQVFVAQKVYMQFCISISAGQIWCTSKYPTSLQHRPHINSMRQFLFALFQLQGEGCEHVSIYSIDFFEIVTFSSIFRSSFAQLFFECLQIFSTSKTCQMDIFVTK